MRTENTAGYKKPLPAPSNQKQYRTFEDLEVYQVARAYGLTDEQLDELVDGSSTLQPFNASTPPP